MKATTGQLRNAGRMITRPLRASPGLVSAAVVMLALAIGANAAMSSLVARALLAAPALVAAPERVHTLGFDPGQPGGATLMTTTSYPAFLDLRNAVDAFADAAAWRQQPATLVVDGVQRQVDAVMVTGTYFELLGVDATIGRPLRPVDGAAAPSVVLGQAFWRLAFGGDPAVLGRRITLDRVGYTVAGVMPPGFSGHGSARVDVWIPMAAALEDTPGWQHDTLRHILSVAVRLQDHATVAAAEAQASAVVGRSVRLRPVGQGADVGAVERRIALGLAALSVVVVILALANTATLLLVRGAGRRRDAAIRVALGASRARLMRQVAAEAAGMAVVAGTLALLAASWFEEGIRRTLLPDLATGAGLDRAAWIAAIAAAILIALIAAAAGALELPAVLTLEALPADERIAGGRRMLQRPLLVVQVTISVVLLGGLGMFARSLYALGAQDFGFRLDDVLLVSAEPGPRPLDDAFFEAAIERVRAVPGVERATFIQAVPFGAFHVPPISIPGLAQPPAAGQQLPFLIASTPDLLEILGVQIVEGRGFTAADERGAPVVIVNQSMATGAWPGDSAVGKCIRIGFDPDFDPFTAAGPPVPSASLPCREVIGVSRDLRQRSVVPTGHEARLMQYFVPIAQVPPPPAGVGGGPGISGLLVRTTRPADGVAAAVNRAVVHGRSDLPLLRVRSYRAVLGMQMRPWQLATRLLAMFATLALVVAAVGLYAAFAHAVASRRREMAIRLAIGAHRGRVIRLVLLDALRLAGAGVVGGCSLAALAGRAAESLLFGTSPLDPIVLAGAAAVMLAVATAATLLPARAAAATDPTALLR